eukprot:TRINITY_DN2615_c0_g1_i1.p2 TRINITY_DN2615_c0_g1~~TRINITY_DN2615_c0_g1_i1.p2  ORF type:complete len:260 (+),score=92.41 TRINITY_DN2615_c0_g1_i1:61-840(+)
MMKLFCVMAALCSFSYAGRNEKSSCNKQTLAAEGSSTGAVSAPEVNKLEFHVNKAGGDGKWFVTAKATGVDAAVIEKVVAGSDDVKKTLLDGVNAQLDAKYTELAAKKGANEGDLDIDLMSDLSNGNFVTKNEQGKGVFIKDAETKAGLASALASINAEGAAAEEPEESASVVGAEVEAKDANVQTDAEEGDGSPKEEAGEGEGEGDASARARESDPEPAPAPAPADAAKDGKKKGKSASVRTGISGVVAAAGLVQMLL